MQLWSNVILCLQHTSICGSHYSRWLFQHLGCKEAAAYKRLACQWEHGFYIVNDHGCLRFKVWNVGMAQHYGLIYIYNISTNRAMDKMWCLWQQFIFYMWWRFSRATRVSNQILDQRGEIVKKLRLSWKIGLIILAKVGLQTSDAAMFHKQRWWMYISPQFSQQHVIALAQVSFITKEPT